MIIQYVMNLLKTIVALSDEVLDLGKQIKNLEFNDQLLTFPKLNIIPYKKIEIIYVETLRLLSLDPYCLVVDTHTVINLY